MLRQMGYAQPDVVGVLLLPPVDRSRTQVMPLGNAYAALAELSHYASPTSVFKAKYHEREAPIQDADPPFGRCFLLPLPDEADDTANRELVDLAGQHLYRDLCSPLGKAADLGRAGLAAPPWQSRGLFYQTFGLYHLAWPRYALLQEAGRRLCHRLLQRWMSKDSKPLREAVQANVREAWTRHDLGSEQMIGRLRDACQELLRKPPEDAFTDVLAPLARRVDRAGRQEGAAGRGPGRRGGGPGGAGGAGRQAVGRECADAPGGLVRRLREASEARSPIGVKSCRKCPSG